jgi:hypothetical protein
MADISTEQREQQIEGVAQQFIDALHALEQGGEDQAHQMALLFRDDAKLANAALDLQNIEVQGRDGILRFWIEYKETLGEAYSKFHQVTTSQNAAGLFWTTQGRNPAGQEIHYHGATLLQWDDTGRIKYFRGYYDTRQLTVRADTPTT